MGKAKAAPAKKADTKLAVKKTAEKPSRAATKKTKDPNMPKRPPSAFFVFMEDFRKEFKEKHPRNKSVAAVGKAAGDKWKQMTDADKAPYVTKANKLKAEYNKRISEYNKGEAATKADAEEDESDKSNLEVEDDHDDDDDEEEEEDDE